MLQKIKSWFTKETIPESDIDVLSGMDLDCVLVYALTPSGVPQVAFNMNGGREQDFISLISMVSQGDFFDLTVTYLKEVGKHNNTEEQMEQFLHILESVQMQSSYNAKTVPFDEEAPIICPTNVFKDQVE